MKKVFISIACLLLPLFIFYSLLNLTSAFAISSAYGSGTPITIYPGETKDIQLKLMTAPGEDNLIIKVELIDNGSIASLTDFNTEYKVNVGEIVPVNLRISVNKAAKTGEEHNIIVKFSDITSSKGEGSVSFKGSSTISLNVLVAQPELKETKGGIGLFFIFLFLLPMLIIAIIIVVWFVVRNRKLRSY